MTLVSMKNTNAGSEGEPALVAKDDEYDYGVRLNISDDKVEALGLTGCKVGDEVTIMGKAKIVSTSEYDDEGGKSASVGIQITDMGVNKETAPSERAGKLYDE